VLGCPRRGELTTRLFGSVTPRVRQHAPCPVLVASPAGRDRRHRVQESVTPVTDQWDTRVVANTSLSCDAASFHVVAEVRAFDDGTCIFQRQWSFEIAAIFCKG